MGWFTPIVTHEDPESSQASLRCCSLAEASTTKLPMSAAGPRKGSNPFPPHCWGQNISYLDYQDNQTSPGSVEYLLNLCQVSKGMLSHHKDEAILVILENIFSLEEFFCDLPVAGAMTIGGRMSLLKFHLCCEMFLHPISIFSQEPSSVSDADSEWWVSAEPSSCLPCEARGSSGHLHLCSPHWWSAQEENTDSWALNSPSVCNRGADRNELFKNWHDMLPVIFRIHHFILAGICFTVGKYFQSHLPLKNVRYFQKLQWANQLILSQLLTRDCNERPNS